MASFNVSDSRLGYFAAALHAAQSHYRNGAAAMGQPICRITVLGSLPLNHRRKWSAITFD